MAHDIQDLFRRRLTQLVITAQAPLVIIGIKSLYEGATASASIMLTVAVVLLFVPLLVRQQNHEAASLLFIGLLTSLVILLQWTFGGIKDNSILALPSILIFAAMIGLRKAYAALLAIMVINLLAMGYFSDRGIEFNPAENGFSGAITVSILLVVIAISARILNRDNQNLLVLLNRQVNEVRQAKEDVERQTLHDPLTQLPNRKYAEKHFADVQERLSRKLIHHAGLLYVDLDDFKDINDTLGHTVGDQFLQAVAREMQACTRSTDRIFRIGGDEFLILVEELDELQLVQMAQKLIDQAMREIVIGGHFLHCTSSIGIVQLPKDANDYAEAVKRADIAMYRSKKSGKNQYHFYDSSMEASVQRRYTLQSQIMSAVIEEQIFIEFQPIVDIPSGHMVGAEILARWAHPELGLISPVEFIPLAEAAGVIDELCLFVMHKALSSVHRMRKVQPEFYVSVNIEPSQLNTKAFFTKCWQIIDETNVSTSALKLEVTESDLIEPTDTFNRNIEQLHQHQIGLLLDDFGTGYSNLAHLQKMDFECIKVDQQFIRNCQMNPETGKLLKAIVAMSHELDVDLIAEGIETEDELAEVNRLGIGKGQGYLFARPMCGEALIDRLCKASTAAS